MKLVRKKVWQAGFKGGGRLCSAKTTFHKCKLSWSALNSRGYMNYILEASTRVFETQNYLNTLNQCLITSKKVNTISEQLKKTTFMCVSLNGKGVWQLFSAPFPNGCSIKMAG